MIWLRPLTTTFVLAARFDQLETLGDTLDTFLLNAKNFPEPESDRYVIKLAVHEIVTNVIDHAYEGRDDGKIEFDLTLKRREFVAIVSDQGVPFEPNLVETPDLENGQIRGYGLFLIEQLMNEVTYQSVTNGNRWRLIKRW
ncbi:MAG: ATP-binding protein [Candidatus Promineifilaceae bacterium]